MSFILKEQKYVILYRIYFLDSLLPKKTGVQYVLLCTLISLIVRKVINKVLFYFIINGPLSSKVRVLVFTFERI